MADQPDPTSIRLPQTTLDRLDVLVPRFATAFPGINVGRADLIRHALLKGLDEVERDLQGANPS